MVVKYSCTPVVIGWLHTRGTNISESKLPILEAWRRYILELENFLQWDWLGDITEKEWKLILRTLQFHTSS